MEWIYPVVDQKEDLSHSSWIKIGLSDASFLTSFHLFEMQDVGMVWMSCILYIGPIVDLWALLDDLRP
eukprot:scaffold94107_cov15-Tisochrysis_lutea.AAC.1